MHTQIAVAIATESATVSILAAPKLAVTPPYAQKSFKSTVFFIEGDLFRAFITVKHHKVNLLNYLLLGVHLYFYFAVFVAKYLAPQSIF